MNMQKTDRYFIVKKIKKKKARKFKTKINKMSTCAAAFVSVSEIEIMGTITVESAW